MNDHPDRDFVIALSLLPYVTPARTRLLLEYFDPLAEVRNASCAVLQGLLSLTPEQAEEVRNPLTNERRNRVAELRTRVVTLFDAEYSALLREIIDPPLVLHFLGDVSLLARPAIAIVGSRRASPYGVNAAQHLARALAPAGLAIVSGLARGIDAAAHHAALDAHGKTIAVLGTGIDVLYPRSNARLFRRIEKEGLIVSEFPPGTPPKPEHFPIRNRVISGLAHGTVIVEATCRSGSLITARMAAEQGREVFAVPGSIFSAGSEGAHRLVQYGAKLVHDANDIFDELPEHLRPAKIAQEAEPESPLREVLAVLSREDALHIDAVASQLQCTSSKVAESLLQLELGGWIRALPGARFVRAK
ncbi:MAG TPA: DNA-processing protein DprA [Thermoanaerobaculia bacterium]|nr:DNA-processing protein DprA [Thermoanaerobaculia bacterium]